MNFVTNKNKLLRFFRYLADRIAGGLFKLSNGRAYGTNVVVCRPSVTDVLRPVCIKSQGKTFYTNKPCALNLVMQNFSDQVKGKHFEIRGWVDGGVEKMCVLSTENWPYLGNSERYGQGCY